MASRAAPSPAWLGLLGALSFGGLVLASFASGYHLVVKTAPQEIAPASADSPAAPEPASPSAAAAPARSAKESPSGPAAPANGSNSQDPTEAVVRPNLRPDRARVRSQPETGAIVGRLPSNQRVSVRGRSGQWLHIEFDRKGKHVDGWTQESNLLLR